MLRPKGKETRLKELHERLRNLNLKPEEKWCTTGKSVISIKKHPSSGRDWSYTIANCTGKHGKEKAEALFRADFFAHAPEDIEFRLEVIEELEETILGVDV